MLVISLPRDTQPLLPGFAAVHPETNSPKAIRCLPRPSPPRCPQSVPSSQPAGAHRHPCQLPSAAWRTAAWRTA